MPVMWLVVGLPLASIIAGVGLVITAVAFLWRVTCAGPGH